tara:strand:- start:629 stop:784 length:156 start_codon:yes stop_codon:yes gene_type:complete
MNYKQQDFMIKIGETASGDIIEVPDMLLYALPMAFLFTLFIIANEKNKGNH